MNFESNLKELEELTQKLEKSDLPLEEAVTLYTKGMQLVTVCQEELQNAKLQITKETVLPMQASEEDETDGTEA